MTLLEMLHYSGMDDGRHFTLMLNLLLVNIKTNNLINSSLRRFDGPVLSFEAVIYQNQDITVHKIMYDHHKCNITLIIMLVSSMFCSILRDRRETWSERN